MDKQELINFLRANEIWAKRTMGQNFLVDQEALAKIVSAADLKSSDTVLEIGPGLGVLTQELSQRAGKVIAIEKDDKFTELLELRIKNDESWKNVMIIHGDALKIHNSKFTTHNSSYKVVANIPYNITSLIIRKFLEEEYKPKILVLLVQKEVAERIVASPGDMSLLAVSVQFYAQAEIVDIVKNTSFFPSPKVNSAIIKLVSKSASKQVSKTEEKDFFRIVKFGFAAKRKTLENNLAAGLHIPKPQASVIIKKAGFEEKIRAEDLSVQNWVTLYRIIFEEGNDRKKGLRKD